MINKDLIYYLSQKTGQIRKEIKSVCTIGGNDSWLFVPKNGKNKVCLVAHIDTVHRENWNQKTIVHDKEQGIMWSPEGLGADDRVGVWAVLYLYNTLDPDLQPYVLLTDKEEVGGLGAEEAASIYGNILDSDDIAYFIEIDREGINDSVFYCDEPESFRQYIKQFGFVEAHGTFSDIGILGDQWNKCAVNLSAGYYHQHTSRELLMTGNIKNTIIKVKRMLEDNARSPQVWRNSLPKDRNKSSELIITCDNN